MEVPHLGFIVAAYAVTALVLALTVAAVLLDGRAQRRALARMERSGTLSSSGDRARPS